MSFDFFKNIGLGGVPTPAQAPKTPPASGASVRPSDSKFTTGPQSDVVDFSFKPTLPGNEKGSEKVRTAVYQVGLMSPGEAKQNLHPSTANVLSQAAEEGQGFEFPPLDGNDKENM